MALSNKEDSMWFEKIKEANVSVHVIATGGGAGLQQKLWCIPGSSAYLSGATFPYAQEEQQEILGFTPEHYCSPEASIDLASVAYMKAYRFGGKKPVGVGITASVASEKEHRGDHRVHVAVITDDKVLTINKILIKGTGMYTRFWDGERCDELGFDMIYAALDLLPDSDKLSVANLDYEDATKLARERFLMRPFFTMYGKRHSYLPNDNKFALMPGAFNPPHEGHFGMADSVSNEYNKRTVFEVTANPPHKDALTVQDLLKRSKMLQGRDRFFSIDIPRYLDKARAYPGMPLVLGADAMVRMLDPKWGFDIKSMLHEFNQLKTKLYVAERVIDNQVIHAGNIRELILNNNWLNDEKIITNIIQNLPGNWDISSTEIRNKLK